MVEVYRAPGEPEARMIQGLLDSFGIKSILKSNAAPSAHIFTVDGLGEVKVMVLEEEAGFARQILEGK